MIIECSSCGARYKYDENKLEGAEGKKVRCSKCKGVIEIKNPAFAAQPAAQEKYAENAMDRTFSVPGGGANPEVPVSEPAAPKTTTRVKKEMMLPSPGELPGKMPENRKISLAVISGSNSGEIFQINKTKMTIGRADSDIVISDLESSRQHARIDVMGDRVILRDLNSTNGTFVNEQKTSATNLENHSEFRIGTTIFMLIITDLD